MQAVFGLSHLQNLLPGEQHLFVLCDSNTRLLCLPLLHTYTSHATVLELPTGEQHKTVDSCRHLWQQLLDAQAGKNAVLICVGGGMVTDLGAFVAATYKRGIGFVLVPTSLLAMVDAAIGGKAAVNEGGIKNSVGLFTHPLAVVVDPVFLGTLPQRELKAGLAEMLKHGLVADARHWEQTVKTALAGNLPDINLIQDSIGIKEQIVAADPLEHGRRKLLNFGHTAGHAIEAASLLTEKPLLHGEAVALGMMMEARLSVYHAALAPAEAEQIIAALTAIYPLLNAAAYETELLQPYLLNDKKKSGPRQNYTLLRSIGAGVWDIEV